VDHNTGLNVRKLINRKMKTGRRRRRRRRRRSRRRRRE
jgi:hypothetical protein